ncbi:phage immunity repressor protein [Yersinia rohdei]|nr:phage immunity repressor protein [Yersinia rohdei]CNI52853.1 phage immunity repressor protein [Yersinia rohdei]
MMRITPTASLNRLSLSESHTNLVISGQFQKTLQLNYGHSQISRNSLIEIDYNKSLELKCAPNMRKIKHGNSPSLPAKRNSLILSKNAVGVGRGIKGEQYSPSVKPGDYSGSAVIQHGCNNENQQVKSKEKGSTVNATLRDYSDGSTLDFLRWRRLISPCMAVTINCPVVSPSSFTNSIASTTSCGARACTFCDLLLMWSLCTTGLHLCLWNPVYIKKEIKKELKWNPVGVYTGIHLIVLFAIKLAKPRSATNTIWASNHNVIGANTMACQHSTQTRPKFQYLFLAVCRSDLNATPHRESVTAHSEQDARRSLAGQFVLSFAGRIPAQGVCNA